MLNRGGLDPALAPPPPPRLPPASVRGVRAVLRRIGETCLVNAIVLQAWEAAHGRRRDLIVGATGPQDFGAHAWLDGDPIIPASDDDLLSSGEPGSNGEIRTFSELLRRPAPMYGRVESGQTP
jgi:Transglutaminase-like superfamily